MRGAIEYGGPLAGLRRVRAGASWKVGYLEGLQMGRGYAHSVRSKLQGSILGQILLLFLLLFWTRFWHAFWAAPGDILVSFWESLGDHFAFQKRSKK